MNYFDQYGLCYWNLTTFNNRRMAVCRPTFIRLPIKQLHFKSFQTEYDLRIPLNISYHMCLPDSDIKWKHFPRYWPIERENHRLLVDIPHKGQWHGALKFPLICAWTHGWTKQSRQLWFETPSRSLWRHSIKVPVFSSQWYIVAWFMNLAGAWYLSL